MKNEKKKTVFRIHMLPAAHGDCLFVEYGEPGAPYRILVDGGVARTYDSLRERLLAIPEDQRSIALLVVSHVDADHIEGVVKMLTDESLDLEIGEVWFNAHSHLTEGLPADFGGVQGEYLSALIQKRKLPWNSSRGGRAICVPDRGPLPVFALPGGLTLTLLSPTLDRMQDMADAWEDEVKKAGLDPDAPKEALAHLETKGKRLVARFADEEGPDLEALLEAPYERDTSPANGSSIAFLAEYQGKRVLFGADAHAEVLASSLERLLAERKLSKLDLDVLKLPHHGSSANVSPKVLELVAMRRALVSTSGQLFHHPDPEAIARVVSRKRGVELVFNYRTAENRLWDDDAARKELGYTTRYPATNDEGISVEVD